MTDPLGLIPTQGLTPGQGVNISRAEKPVEGPGFKDVLMQNIQQTQPAQHVPSPLRGSDFGQ